MHVREEQVDEIMAAPKQIVESIKWKQDDSKDGVFEFDVPIEIDYPCKLHLYGSYNAILDRFSFTVVYNGLARIKALDIGKEHLNRCEKHGYDRVGEKHKHSWKDCCKDRFAYKPEDITSGAPIQQVFMEFLKECNISYSGALPPLPPEQQGLWDYVDLPFN